MYQRTPPYFKKMTERIDNKIFGPEAMARSERLRDACRRGVYVGEESCETDSLWRMLISLTPEQQEIVKAWINDFLRTERNKNDNNNTKTKSIG